MSWVIGVEGQLVNLSLVSYFDPAGKDYLAFASNGSLICRVSSLALELAGVIPKESKKRVVV